MSSKQSSNALVPVEKKNTENQVSTKPADLLPALRLAGKVLSGPHVCYRSHSVEAITNALTNKEVKWTVRDREKMTTALDLGGQQHVGVVDPSFITPAEYSNMVRLAYKIDGNSPIGSSFTLDSGRKIELVNKRSVKGGMDVVLIKTNNKKGESLYIACIPGTRLHRFENHLENAHILVNKQLRPSTYSSIKKAIKDMAREEKQKKGKEVHVSVVAGHSLGGHAAYHIAGDPRMNIFGVTVNPYNTKPQKNVVSYQTDFNITSLVTDHEVHDASVDSIGVQLVRFIEQIVKLIKELREAYVELAKEAKKLVDVWSKKNKKERKIEKKIEKEQRNETKVEIREQRIVEEREIATNPLETNLLEDRVAMGRERERTVKSESLVEEKKEEREKVKEKENIEERGLKERERGKEVYVSSFATRMKKSYRGTVGQNATQPLSLSLSLPRSFSQLKGKECTLPNSFLSLSSSSVRHRSMDPMSGIERERQGGDCVNEKEQLGYVEVNDSLELPA